MLSNLLENGEKCIEKCNVYIKYFDKIKCYADRPYLVFFKSWNLKHTYIVLALLRVSERQTHVMHETKMPVAWKKKY